MSTRPVPDPHPPLKYSDQPASGTRPIPQRWARMIEASWPSAQPRCVGATYESMRRKYRAWSSAVVCESPQMDAGLKLRMPTRRASATSRRSPTIATTRVAAVLSDRRIIGVSSAVSARVSGRLRTDGRSRYATSSIAFSTLAVTTTWCDRYPHSRVPARTANEMSPWRRWA